MQIMDTHYQVWVEGPDYWQVYFHVRRGQGRSARRRLTGVYTIQKPPAGATSPDLMRLLALEMEERTYGIAHGAPAPPASPGGPQGEPSTLT